MELKDFSAAAGFVVVIATGLIGFGGVLYQLRRVIEDFQKMQSELATVHNQLLIHQADEDKHVNKPYMTSLEHRLDKLETSVENGHRRIEEKIDRLAEKIFTK